MKSCVIVLVVLSVIEALTDVIMANGEMKKIVSVGVRLTGVYAIILPIVDLIRGL